jgi:small subunit ribosomal protein S18
MMYKKSFSRLSIALAKNQRREVTNLANRCNRSFSSSINDEDDDLTRPISSGIKSTKRSSVRPLTPPSTNTSSSTIGPSSRLSAPSPLGLDEIIDGPSASGAASSTREAADESATAIVIATAQAQSQFEHVRRLLSQQADRLRRFDEFALASAKREAAAAARAAEGLPFESESTNATSGGDSRGISAPAQGLAVDYCIFCYHGTRGLLKHDNTSLLSRFVSERGALLPKRFTKACAKHQRRLAQTVKRSRWLNLLPFHGKLHPRLRFSGLRVPEPTRNVTSPGVAMSGDVPS